MIEQITVDLPHADRDTNPPAWMKRVLFISTVFPFPVDSGKSAVVWGILKYLIEKHGAEQVTYVLLGRNGEAFSVTDFPCRYLTLEKPSTLRRLWNIFWFILVRRSKSIQELMIYSPKLDSKLHTIVAEINPDLVICDTFRVGQFFETPGRAASSYILYMDDLFSVRYQKMLRVMKRHPQAQVNPLGNFAHFVPLLLRSFANVGFVQRRLLRAEQKLVEKRERDCLAWFDKTLLINEVEADLLRKETRDPSIRMVKPLLTNARHRADRRYGGEPVFVFLGALNLPHNHFSIVHFIECQMDKILKKMPGARLRIIGRDGSSELNKLAEKYRGSVVVEGFVEDLDAVFRESCAMVIPLLFGSGVKIKTLEALSRGLPVISTDFGVEGIPITNAVNCVIENDIDRYPQLMLELTDLDYNRAISLKAREFYFKHYSRERLFEEYEILFEETTAH
jgi:glycosyltransferase involved in cell wall biosynthesis